MRFLAAAICYFVTKKVIRARGWKVRNEKKANTDFRSTATVQTEETLLRLTAKAVTEEGAVLRLHSLRSDRDGALADLRCQLQIVPGNCSSQHSFVSFGHDREADFIPVDPAVGDWHFSTVVAGSSGELTAGELEGKRDLPRSLLTFDRGFPFAGEVCSKSEECSQE